MRLRTIFFATALSLPVALGAQTMNPPADEPVAFQTLDENDDGFISRDEAKGTYLANRFDALDTDHDGRLSPSEVAAGSPAAAE
jgi:transaldolase